MQCFHFRTNIKTFKENLSIFPSKLWIVSHISKIWPNFCFLVPQFYLSYIPYNFNEIICLKIAPIKLYICPIKLYLCNKTTYFHYHYVYSNLYRLNILTPIQLIHIRIFSVPLTIYILPFDIIYFISVHWNVIMN